MQNIATGQGDEFNIPLNIPELTELYERLKNTSMLAWDRKLVQTLTDAADAEGDDIMAAAYRAAAAKGLDLAVEG